MLSHVEAQIYLSDQRGKTEITGYRSFHTLNFGKYSNPDRGPFENILFINDNTLGQSGTTEQKVRENAGILLLPLVGSCGYHAGFDQGVVEPGEAHLLLNHRSPAVQIANVYQEELINYLTIGFSTDRKSDNQRISFDIDKNVSQLVPIISDTSAIEAGVGPIYIGRFGGRVDGIYKVQNPKGVFIFVIEGAFEVQNRLLQSRDALALRNVTEIEFEALSNDAILLIMEGSE